MDENNNQNGNQISPEEQKAEEETLNKAQEKEDEVRNQIVSEYGFSEEDDKEMIDKLVNKELEHRKALSSAIGQKRKYREQMESNEENSGDENENNNPPKGDGEENKEDQPSPNQDINTKISEAFERRDLDEMPYSDDLKGEIKKVAKLQGVSVKKAAEDSYIQSKINEWKEEQETDEAAIGRKNQGGAGNKQPFSADNPPECDMTTEEGRKKWAEYTDWLSKQPGYN